MTDEKKNLTEEETKALDGALESIEKIIDDLYGKRMGAVLLCVDTDTGDVDIVSNGHPDAVVQALIQASVHLGITKDT